MHGSERSLTSLCDVTASPNQFSPTVVLLWTVGGYWLLNLARHLQSRKMFVRAFIHSIALQYRLAILLEVYCIAVNLLYIIVLRWSLMQSNVAFYDSCKVYYRAPVLR